MFLRSAMQQHTISYNNNLPPSSKIEKLHKIPVLTCELNNSLQVLSYKEVLINSGVHSNVPSEVSWSEMLAISHPGNIRMIDRSESWVQLKPKCLFVHRGLEAAGHDAFRFYICAFAGLRQAVDNQTSTLRGPFQSEQRSTPSGSPRRI